MMFPYFSKTSKFVNILKSDKPVAVAIVRGDPQHQSLNGEVRFYSATGGTLVQAEIYGLPKVGTADCPEDVFGFHVHEGATCTGTKEEPFQDVGKHLNPNHCNHPAHMGDLPPLFGNNGYAWTTFFTDRFKPADVIGHTVIVHGGHDDFTTQPSGNSGPMIGCGEIYKK